MENNIIFKYIILLIMSNVHNNGNGILPLNNGNERLPINNSNQQLIETFSDNQLVNNIQENIQENQIINLNDDTYIENQLNDENFINSQILINEDNNNEEKFQCNLCLEEYKLDTDDYKTFPYKLCLNDHYFCGNCIENYIKCMSKNFCHLFNYFPKQMCMIIKCYPLHDFGLKFFNINCPTCRLKIKINYNTKLDRSRIFEQIIKGNINYSSNIGKEISIFNSTSNNLENKILEFKKINDEFKNNLIKISNIQEDKDKKIILSQKKIYLLNKLISDKRKEYKELKNNFEGYKSDLKDEAFKEIQDELNLKKFEMNIILEEYRLNTKTKFNNIYNFEKNKFDIELSNYHNEIKNWRKQVDEIDIKMKSEIKKFNIELQKNKEEFVWNFIKENNILRKFIELVKKENIKEIEDEKNTRLNLINQIINKEREHLIQKMYDDLEIERENITN